MGYKNEDCTECAARRQIKCKRCHGTGVIDCRKCSGRGYILDTACEGSGKVATHLGFVDHPLCNGTGKIPCKTTEPCPIQCNNGWLGCELCGGNGYIAVWFPDPEPDVVASTWGTGEPATPSSGGWDTGGELS